MSTIALTAMICSIVSCVCAAISNIIRIHDYNRLSGKSKFPKLLADPLERNKFLFDHNLLSSAILSSISGKPPAFEKPLQDILRKELRRSKRFWSKAKRRKYQRITVFNIITIIRKECL